MNNAPVEAEAESGCNDLWTIRKVYLGAPRGCLTEFTSSLRSVTVPHEERVMKRIRITHKIEYYYNTPVIFGAHHH
jgi:hypothetical protein